MKKTVICGGGAAGLFAACMLAKGNCAVTVLEKQDRVGRKLLSTGNGRCNLSNLRASPEHYHGDARFVRTVLNAFPPKAALDFFGEMGLPCVTDNEGRAYPMSNQAASVLDALRLYAAEHGVKLETGFTVTGIVRRGGGFIVRTAQGKDFPADSVIVTCGGLAAPKLGGCADGHRLLEAMGHTVTPCMPAIVSLKTDPKAVRGLKGIRARCTLTLNDRRTEEGELLFSENGLSGICAMQLAGDINTALRKHEPCRVRIDFMPGSGNDTVDRLCRQLPERTLEDLLSGIVPKRLGQALIREAGVSPLSLKASELTAAKRGAIQKILRGWTLPVTGTLDYDAAQVTRGGIELRGFDPMTMESRRVRGLYAAGEVLDADGDCGGFNLQWAWSTAAVAARSILSQI